MGVLVCPLNQCGDVTCVFRKTLSILRVFDDVTVNGIVVRQQRWSGELVLEANHKKLAIACFSEVDSPLDLRH